MIHKRALSLIVPVHRYLGRRFALSWGYIQIRRPGGGHSSDQCPHRAQCALCPGHEGEKGLISQENASQKGDIALYDDLIAKTSEKYRVDSALVKAIIKAESNFNHRAVSPVGARGLMQLMPATAATLQVKDSFHPENNIDGGVRYLRYLMNLFNGNLPLVLAAYNAGENAVLRYNNRIPPYQETQTYVRRVLDYFNRYSSGNRVP